MPEAWQTAVKSRLLPGPLGPLQRPTACMRCGFCVRREADPARSDRARVEFSKYKKPSQAIFFMYLISLPNRR
jgi:hypothetical protein